MSGFSAGVCATFYVRHLFKKILKTQFLCRRISDLSNALGSSIFSSQNMNSYFTLYFSRDDIGSTCVDTGSKDVSFKYD